MVASGRSWLKSYTCPLASVNNVPFCIVVIVVVVVVVVVVVLLYVELVVVLWRLLPRIRTGSSTSKRLWMSAAVHVIIVNWRHGCVVWNGGAEGCDSGGHMSKVEKSCEELKGDIIRIGTHSITQFVRYIHATFKWWMSEWLYRNKEPSSELAWWKNEKIWSLIQKCKKYWHAFRYSKCNDPMKQWPFWSVLHPVPMSQRTAVHIKQYSTTTIVLQ